VELRRPRHGGRQLAALAHGGVRVLHNGEPARCLSTDTGASSESFHASGRDFVGSHLAASRCNFDTFCVAHFLFLGGRDLLQCVRDRKLVRACSADGARLVFAHVPTRRRVISARDIGTLLPSFWGPRLRGSYRKGKAGTSVYNAIVYTM